MSVVPGGDRVTDSGCSLVAFLEVSGNSKISSFAGNFR